MALPLVFLGAAVLLSVEAAQDRKRQYRRRMQFPSAKRLDQLAKHDSPVATYPTELLSTRCKVKPRIGAIVCCSIGGALEHTGIWIDDNTIAELDGNGLIKPVSCQRFLQNRSGNKIFIACDSTQQALADSEIAERAITQLYTMENYHLIDNNCHQFVWRCFNQDNDSITSFKSLNKKIASFYNRVIYWDLLDVAF